MERRSGRKGDPEPPPVDKAGPKPSKPATRSAAPVADLDFDLNEAFPQMKMFHPGNKLPTIASVVGMIRHYKSLSKGLKGKQMTGKVALREVAKILEAKWYHDSLPCIDFEALVKRLDGLYTTVLNGSRDMRRAVNRTTTTKYKELVGDKDKLYDIFETDKEKRKDKELEWGVSMGKMEMIYLEDMRGDRKMECGGSVDPVWYRAVMKKQREKEKSDANKEEMANQFLFKPLSAIEEILNTEGDLVKRSSESEISDEDNNILPSVPETLTVEDVSLEVRTDVSNVDDQTRKKKKIFSKQDTNNNDPLPIAYRHVRLSERKVKDVIYKALANLSGEGLSLLESVKAVVEVANCCFDRKWRIPSDDDQTLDINTMPHSKSIR